jgi:hypothetical protein
MTRGQFIQKYGWEIVEGIPDHIFVHHDVTGMNREATITEVILWNELTFFEVERIGAELVAKVILETCLEKMKHADNFWCEYGIGNPNYHDHSTVCKQLQEYFKVGS